MFFAQKFSYNGLHYQISGDNAVLINQHPDSVKGGVRIPSYVVYNGVEYDVTGIRSQAFYFCEKVTGIDIQAPIRKIGSQTFFNCTGLRMIILPSTIAEIEEQAFANCVSLEEITIPKNVRRISHGVFYNCISLKDVVLHESIRYIKDEAFFRCKAIERLDIPFSVDEIGYRAFGDCTSLKEIHLETEYPPRIYPQTFNTQDESVLFIPKGTVDIYKTTDEWNRFKNMQEL